MILALTKGRDPMVDFHDSPAIELGIDACTHAHPFTLFCLHASHCPSSASDAAYEPAIYFRFIQMKAMTVWMQ